MNSLVSYSWLREYVDLNKITPDEFAKRISLSGPAVEKIIPRGADLDRVIVGRIAEIGPHPNADKLRIVSVDIGAPKHLPLVCGGTNLSVGQWVAVAQTGARVKWHGQGDFITLEAAEIRGVKSEGMICAANEIGLGEAFPHAEREILDLGLEIPGLRVNPGTPLADALGLSDDVVMDVEVTSNRVDAMGMVGFAREASAIFGRNILWKEPALPAAAKPKANGPVKVVVEDKKFCPRYMAVRLTGLTNGKSPWWMKQRLFSAGLRPISLLVDITNYVMLETAQPMHVFDTKKLIHGAKGPEIRVRRAAAGETMKALDGKTYELDKDALVIADAKRPVAVAGIMGGEETGADASTTDAVFECASFDPVSVRRTARRLNLMSDAQLRFEKGLSTEGVPSAMARAIELALELCGGEIAGPGTDVRVGTYKPRMFSTKTDDVAARIGVEIPAARQAKILKDLGFKVTTSGKTLKAVAPWWRDHDIEAAIDLTEEIARVYGYANITPELPVGALPPRQPDAKLVWEDRIKTIAEGAGLTETYTYSFVSEDLYRRAGFDPSACLRLLNPLSEEFAIMRTSLLPSLLGVISENREKFPEQKIFEVANVYVMGRGGKGERGKGLPEEKPMLAGAFLAGEESWRIAKGFAEHLFEKLGIRNANWRRVSEDGFWHPGRSLQAYDGEKLLATVGEVAPAIREHFKIDGRLAMIDMPLDDVFAVASTAKAYTPPSPFPESKRDLAVVVDRNTEFGDVLRTIKDIDALVQSVEWFDTYEGKGVPDGEKSLAMHLTFSSREKTLTTEEVDALMEKISLALKEKFEAEIR